MAYFKATVDILVEADNEDDACDCIVETLREQLREFSPGSPLIDWRYAGATGDPEPHDGNGFEYVLMSVKSASQTVGGDDVSTE